MNHATVVFLWGPHWAVPDLPAMLYGAPAPAAAPVPPGRITSIIAERTTSSALGSMCASRATSLISDCWIETPELIERPDGRTLKVANLVEDDARRETVISALKDPKSKPAAVFRKRLGIDRYRWPLAVAIFLLVAESLLRTRRRTPHTA